MSFAVIAAGSLLACVVAGALAADPPVELSLALSAAGTLILLLAIWHPEWELGLHVAAAILLGMLAGWAEDRVWWLAVAALVAAVAGR